MADMTLNKQNLNTLAIALLFSANTLVLILPIPNIIIGLIALSILIAFLANGILLFFKNKKITIFLCALLSIFFIELIVFSDNKDLNKYFLSFLVFGLPALLMSQLRFSKQLLYRIMSAFGLVMIPVMVTYNFDANTSEAIDYGNWMGVSYGILRLMIPLIIVMYFSKKIINKLSIFLIIMFYMNIQLKYGSRGALLSLVIFWLVFTLIKSKNIKVTLGLISLISIIGGNLALNFLIKKEVNFFFLKKILESDDLSNGRYNIYSRAWEGVTSSPVYGNGIAAYENLYHEGYVHNLFIQVAYEFGLLGVIFFAYIIFKPFWHWKKLHKEEAIFLVFLFCSGLIQLLFSNFYWSSQFLWFLIGYVLTKKFFKNSRKISILS